MRWRDARNSSACVGKLREPRCSSRVSPTLLSAGPACARGHSAGRFGSWQRPAASCRHRDLADRLAPVQHQLGSINEVVTLSAAMRRRDAPPRTNTHYACALCITPRAADRGTCIERGPRACCSPSMTSTKNGRGKLRRQLSGGRQFFGDASAPATSPWARMLARKRARTSSPSASEV